MVCTDMLGDATRFTGSHSRLSDVVEQRRLAVIDMSHDSYHRGSCSQFAFNFQRMLQFLLDRLFLDDFGFMSKFLHDQYGGILIQHLVDCRHHTHSHQLLDHIASFYRYFMGQLTKDDGFANFYFVLDELRFFERSALIDSWTP